MIHDLKIEENYLDNLISGAKKSEVRLNDRDYQKGDLLAFKKYNLDNVTEFLFEVTHIHSGLGMQGSYVVLSLSPIESGDKK